jgi:hypothetical protein
MALTEKRGVAVLMVNRWWEPVIFLGNAQETIKSIEFRYHK